MESPIHFFSKIWIYAIFYLKYITYLIALSVSSVITVPFMFRNVKDVKNGILFSRVLKHVTKILRITWYIRNKEVLLKDRGAVVVVNHQSAIDVLGLTMIWHLFGKMTTVAKKELMYLGPFGLGCYMVGTIFIDRRKPQEAHKKLKTSSEILFKNKTKVLFFPEGTRNISANILPFKKGAFNLAIDCQVPIIPIVISPYYFLNAKQRIFNKGQVIVQCLEAVSTEGLTKDDVPELSNRIRDMMNIEYQKLSEETKKLVRDDFSFKNDSNTEIL